MKFVHNGVNWKISKNKSIFVSRTDKEDVNIYKQSNWGHRDPDNNLYCCCMKIAAEDGTILRSYEDIPEHITVDFLKQSGFINNI